MWSFKLVQRTTVGKCLSKVDNRSVRDVQKETKRPTRDLIDDLNIKVDIWYLTEMFYDSALLNLIRNKTATTRHYSHPKKNVKTTWLQDSLIKCGMPLRPEIPANGSR